MSVDKLTDQQMAVVNRYSIGSLGLVRAASQLEKLGLTSKQADKVLAETGTAGGMWAI